MRGSSFSASFVPAGVIVMSTSTCPSGWTRLNSWDGRFVLGSPTGESGVAITSGTAYTSDRPNLSFVAHSHSLTVPTDNQGSTLASANVGAEGIVNTSTIATASTNFETTLPYIQVIFCIKN